MSRFAQAIASATGARLDLVREDLRNIEEEQKEIIDTRDKLKGVLGTCDGYDSFKLVSALFNRLTGVEPKSGDEYEKIRKSANPRYIFTSMPAILRFKDNVAIIDTKEGKPELQHQAYMMATALGMPLVTNYNMQTLGHGYVRYAFDFGGFFKEVVQPVIDAGSPQEKDTIISRYMEKLEQKATQEALPEISDIAENVGYAERLLKEQAEEAGRTKDSESSPAAGM